MITAFMTGVVLGLAGSAHCVAMCGPLLGALAPRGTRAALHHAGRALAYVVLGVAAGLAGFAMHAAGLGKWWAFALAAGLLLQAAARALPIHVPREIGPVSRAFRRLSSAVGTWSARHRVIGPLSLGVANGLLPCGLVLGATTMAAGLADVPAAVALMAGFAAGTTPALTAGLFAFDALRRRAPVLNTVTPILLVVLAVLLIARGLHAPGVITHVH